MSFFMESLTTILSSTTFIVSAYFPRLIAGLLILFIGLIVGSLLKDLIIVILKYFRLEKWLGAAGLVEEQEIRLWPNLIAELFRWTTIFVFLISAFEIWGISRVGEVLNQLLSFLPNVLVAIVIGWAGLVAGRFAFDIVRHGVRGLSARESLFLASVAKYAIVFFAVLAILTHLGVAAELTKILFTGIVGMLALAFGLAFGLGGQEEAKDILKKLRRKLEK